MKRPAVVIDTNVPVVANGKTEQASTDCVSNCIGALRGAREKQLVLVDDTGLIFDEYRRNLHSGGQPGLGDAFFKWLWDNRANRRHCVQVALTETGPDGFVEFPKDPALKTFDPSDRKFVAVAIASKKKPTILNATDTDWWSHQQALRRHGVTIRFLCPELMRRPT